MYSVTRIIHFCYGHRLREYDGKCRYLHGHNGKVEIELSSDRLDPRGMVKDFEEIKRTVGLVERLDGQNISNMVSAIIEYIFSEAHKVLTIYQTRHRRSIEKVILIGSGALLKGLLPAASQTFEVPVTLGAPFSKVEYPAFLETALSQTGPGFAVAMGIALRQLEGLG